MIRLAVLILLAFATAGCPGSSATDPDAVPSDEDHLRVISLAPNVTEIVAALGASDRLVGRSTHCDFPPEVTEVPSVGSGMDPDPEQLVALRPTLILATEAQAGLPALDRMRDAGVEVMVIDDVALDDVPRAIRALGARLSRVAEAEAIAMTWELRIAEVRRATAGMPTPRALIAVGQDPLYAAGPESRVGELLTIAGGVNALAEGDWVLVDDETLLRSRPEVIVDATGLPEAWLRHPSLPAVRDRRICEVDADRLARPGPRLADALVELVDCIHPGLPLSPLARGTDTLPEGSSIDPPEGSESGQNTPNGRQIDRPEGSLIDTPEGNVAAVDGGENPTTAGNASATEGGENPTTEGNAAAADGGENPTPEGSASPTGGGENPTTEGNAAAAADGAERAVFGGDVLHLATWNIEWLHVRDDHGPNPRQPADYARLAELVDTVDADVWVLQEVQGVEAARRVFDPADWSMHAAEQDIPQRVVVVWRNGLDVTVHADLEALDVGGVREGVDLTVRWGDHALRVLGVHLKSGCWGDPLDTDSNACTKLSLQLPVIEAWIDARAVEDTPFAVVGDFNRRLADADPFWVEIDDGEPAMADLTLTSAGRSQQCWGSRYPDYIDHIVLDARSAAWWSPDAFAEFTYDAYGEAFEDVLSDHCPIRVVLDPSL